MAHQTEIVRDVEAAYRNYVEVFNGRDPNAIAELYDRPHAQVVAEMGLSVVNDDAEQQQWFELVMAYLDGQGWGRTEIDQMQVWPLSPTLAQLVATVTRYDTDGAELEQVRANYTFRCRNGDWKVILSFPLLAEGFESPAESRP